jgi:hypothetical protein
MPYALAWRLLCSKGMGAQVLSASCRAAVSRAHAHRPLGERDAHGLVREKRGELSSLDAACCACTPRASHEAAPIPSGAYFGTRSHGMPSVMDAPELMEYVETHAFTIETRERPQPRRAHPAFGRTLAQKLTPYLPPTLCQQYAPVCRACRPFETPWTGWHASLPSSLPLPWPFSESAPRIAPFQGHRRRSPVLREGICPFAHCLVMCRWLKFVSQERRTRLCGAPLFTRLARKRRGDAQPPSQC